MANTVAGLVVTLGLNATDYVQGLTKAEYQAKKFSQSFSAGMGALKGALGGLGIGLVVSEIFDLSKSIIDAAADLNDFADQTGSSVESLSKLANQAAIAGTPFEELQQAVLKLSIGMGGTGEKSQKLEQILKTLGVTAKDPAEAMQQIAVGFAKYEDGATKAAYATELFGKSGAKFLATLADMAKLQDVVGTTTAEQAKRAEELGQSYRRAAVEMTFFKNAILDLVFPLTDIVRSFREARQAGEGFFSSLLRAHATARAILTGTNKPAFDYSIFDKEKTAVLPPTPTSGGGGGRAARAPQERISDAQRYLEQLQRQLQATKELTVVEKILLDISEGRLKAGKETSAILAVGEQIDAANALKEAEKDRLKLAADEARIREQTSQMKQRGIAELKAETDALAQGNEQMRQEIEAIGLDATSLAQLTKARLEAVAATKDQAAAMFRNQEGMEAEAKQMEDQARILRERKGLIDQQGVATKMAEDVAKAKEINDLFVNSFAEGASSVIRNAKSIGDAIKGMGRSITDALTNLAAKNIATSLFGAATSSGGGGIFAGIGTLLGGMFGGMASGGPVAANQPYVVGERGPELFMPRSAGTIIPNNQMTSGRGNFVFNINVPPGASRSTIEQTRLKFGMELQNVMDRHG